MAFSYLGPHPRTHAPLQRGSAGSATDSSVEFEVDASSSSAWPICFLTPNFCMLEKAIPYSVYYDCSFRQVTADGAHRDRISQRHLRLHSILALLRSTPYIRSKCYRYPANSELMHAGCTRAALPTLQLHCTAASMEHRSNQYPRFAKYYYHSA